MKILGEISDDQVFKHFLASEIHRFGSNDAGSVRMLLAGNDNDVGVIYERRRALYSIRYPLLAQIPNPFSSYRGELEEGDLSQLRVIRNCGWDDTNPGNLLRNSTFPTGFGQEAVDKIRAIEVNIDSVRSKPIILMSQTLEGPFTILDGNNRATAMLVTKSNEKFNEAGIPVDVLISERMAQCIWYAP